MSEIVYEPCTRDEFSSEQEAMGFLLAYLRAAERMGWVHVHEEVELYPRGLDHHQVTKVWFRADILVMPQPPMLELGWKLGDIIIECKRSTKGLGRALAQLNNYTRSHFAATGGRFLKPGVGFLFPGKRLDSDHASMCEHMRIGTARAYRSSQLLAFRLGQSDCMTIDRTGRVEVHARGKSTAACRSGSRG